MMDDTVVLVTHPGILEAFTDICWLLTRVEEVYVLPVCPDSAVPLEYH